MTVRFAKLRNEDLEWWMKTVEAMAPDARKKLEMFSEAVSNLKKNGDLQGVAALEIESDERWINKRKSVLADTLKRSRLAIEDGTGLPVKAMMSDRGNSPTVGDSQIKHLGMNRRRRG